MKRGFGSDNHSGVHPKIMEALQNVNSGHSIAYGDDEYTQLAVEKFKEIFNRDIDVFFVSNGTAANVLGICAVTKSFNSIICAEDAHLNLEECGAPENYIGCKLIAIPANDGKINVELIKKHVDGITDVHRTQPKVISITQTSEFGTVYKPDEIEEISKFARKNNMILHMDGARISNAAVHLGMDFKQITYEVGIDVLSFGGIKNGMMFGEAVIFFDKKLAEDFPYIRKQGMQLTSKMRYISAQFEAYLTDDLWKKNAEHSNKMAKYMEEKLRDIPLVKIKQVVESNAVFAEIPQKYITALQEKFVFYARDSAQSVARLMSSFDTTKEDIDGFVDSLKNMIR